MIFLIPLMAAFVAPNAWATRMVNFSGTGQNYYGGKAHSNSYSSCSVTISNPSSASQTVTFTFTLTATSTPNLAAFNTSYTNTHTITLAPLASAVATNCAANSNSCTFPDSSIGDTTVDFATIDVTTAGTTAYTQDVSCSGTISVDDTTAGTPGYVIASGMISTYRESLGGASLSGSGGTSKTVSSMPSTQSFQVGQGRPF